MEGYNKMKVITVTNQKGGTGKTSTTLFMAYGIARQGKKILVIDLDQQADSSFSFHVPYEDSQSTFQLLTGTATLPEIIVNATDKIDLAPASPDLSQLDLLLAGKLDPQFILKDALKAVSDKYDYIIIDTPPSLNMAVLNALTSSNTVVVPTQADLYSLKGLNELAQTVEGIKRRSNPDLDIAGILIGRYNARTVFTKAITSALEEMAGQLHTTVFKSKIREAIAVKESQNAFKSMFDYDPHGKVTEDIQAFIDEFMEKEN
jgi:chromosome partitioning protein